MTMELLSGGFDELLNDKNSDMPLEQYLEEFLKRLQEMLSADEGFTKLNFTEPAFVVSKAAKVWGKKVDSLDEFLHAILHRAVSGNREGEGSEPDLGDGEVHNEDSNGPTHPENVPRKQKQKTAGWTLEDLRSLSDILRPVAASECENIDLHKNTNDVEMRNTLRPRINFDLHPVYRLPISIQIKNISGDVMGDYCDFFSNTFDVEQVSKLLEGQTAGDRTLEMMDVDNGDDDEDVTIVNETGLLFTEPIKLDADSEAVMKLCPNLMGEEPPNQSTMDPNSQVPQSQEETGFSSMPGLEPQSIYEPEEKPMEVIRDDTVTSRDRNARQRTGPITATIPNKFLTRLDPYDASMEAKKSKPLAKNPGKPYKLPTAHKQKDEAPAILKLVVDKSDDVFSQHMPPLKPPSQMPASIADSVSVELSEQMVQKFNDNVLVACGRKSQAQTGRQREAEGAEAQQNIDEIPLSQEAIIDLDNDDDSDAEEGGGDAVEPPLLELPGLVNNEEAGAGDAGLEPLPGIQNLEEMVPPNVFDENRLKRLQSTQDWDRYVESRLAAVERTPFDVNDYCVKMVTFGQQAGKKKWFSLEQTVMKMVKEKEHGNSDPAKLNLGVRREGARSLVSLLFLANSGNVEFRNKTGASSDLEVRLMSEAISRVAVDSRGLESPSHRTALTAQHQ